MWRLRPNHVYSPTQGDAFTGNHEYNVQSNRRGLRPNVSKLSGCRGGHPRSPHADVVADLALGLAWSSRADEPNIYPIIFSPPPKKHSAKFLEEGLGGGLYHGARVKTSIRLFPFEMVGAEGPLKLVRIESPLETVRTKSRLKLVGTESSLELVRTESLLWAVGTESSLEVVGIESPLELVGTKSPLGVVAIESSLELVRTKSPLGVLAEGDQGLARMASGSSLEERPRDSPKDRRG
ncbi:hypothetical protein B296_00031056 [Ensete ventricosum]|uniref:Uncharacterized protein n=1 Tax=Ensete ventricosum TaxID=4639 RepID=A0A426XIW8_ENSVE|nr:hypothetical protein B296_00031056 [Ensete ventricosum]